MYERPQTQSDGRSKRYPPVMVGGDDGIGAVSFGFRSDGEDQYSAQKTADRRDQEQEPWGKWVFWIGRPGDRGFPARMRLREVPDNDSQGVVLDCSGSEIEADRAKSGDDSHQDRQAHEPHLGLDAPSTQLDDLRKPTEQPIHGKPMRKTKAHRPTCPLPSIRRRPVVSV